MFGAKLNITRLSHRQRHCEGLTSFIQEFNEKLSKTVKNCLSIEFEIQGKVV